MLYGLQTVFRDFSANSAFFTNLAGFRPLVRQWKLSRWLIPYTHAHTHTHTHTHARTHRPTRARAFAVLRRGELVPISMRTRFSTFTNAIMSSIKNSLTCTANSFTQKSINVYHHCSRQHDKSFSVSYLLLPTNFPVITRRCSPLPTCRLACVHHGEVSGVCHGPLLTG